MGKEHYILRKNGGVIFTGNNWDDVRSKIPVSHHGHENDKYDYVSIKEEGDNINLNVGKDVYNSFVVYYNELNGGEYSEVSIPKKDLVDLLKGIGIILQMSI